MPTVFSTATTSGRLPDIHKRLIVTMTGAGGGAITVPHTLSYTPNVCVINNVYDLAGPAVGPTVNLDVQTVPAGMDATNVYLFTTGPGTVELLIG